MKTFDMKALKNRWFGKTNKTAWFISLVISLGAVFILKLFLDNLGAWFLGSVVFHFLNLILSKRPELMGKLHKPDDRGKEEDNGSL